jgi:hypothetical protein
MNGRAKPDQGFEVNADPDLHLLFQGQEKSRIFELGLRDQCSGSGFNHVSGSGFGIRILNPDPKQTLSRTAVFWVSSDFI